MSSFETPDRQDKDVNVQRGGLLPPEQLPRYTARTALNQVYTLLLGMFVSATIVQLILFCHIPSVWLDRIPLIFAGLALFAYGLSHYTKRFPFPPILLFAIVAGAMLALSTV